MLEHLLGEILSLLGICVVFYFAFSAVLRLMLWLLHVVSAPVDRLDLWVKSKAPQRTYTRTDHLRGYAILVATFGIMTLALHVTVGLH